MTPGGTAGGREVGSALGLDTGGDRVRGRPPLCVGRGPRAAGWGPGGAQGVALVPLGRGRGLPPGEGGRPLPLV